MTRLIALFLFVGAIQAPQTGDKHKQTNNADTGHNETRQEPDNCTPSVVINETANSPSSEQERHSEGGTPPHPSHDWVDKLNAWSTVVIALFAIVTAIAVCLQVRTAGNSERAWVFIETAEIRSSHRGSIPVWEVYPTLKNRGRTVARITKIYSGSEILQTNQNLPREPVYKEEQTFSFPLYPEGESQPIGFGVGQENFRTVQDGMLKLWVYGKVEYLDFLNRKRHSGFCLIYNPAGVGPKPIPEGFRAAVATDILLKYAECT